MNEQIFLGGRPAVGFGGSEVEEKKFYAVALGVPLVGLVAGAAAGYFVGRIVQRPIGSILGTIVGGFGGTMVGIGIMPLIMQNAADAQSTKVAAK